MMAEVSCVFLSLQSKCQVNSSHKVKTSSFHIPSDSLFNNQTVNCHCILRVIESVFKQTKNQYNNVSEAVFVPYIEPYIHIYTAETWGKRTRAQRHNLYIPYMR